MGNPDLDRYKATQNYDIERMRMQQNGTQFNSSHDLALMQAQMHKDTMDKMLNNSRESSMRFYNHMDETVALSRERMQMNDRQHTQDNMVSLELFGGRGGGSSFGGARGVDPPANCFLPGNNPPAADDSP